MLVIFKIDAYFVVQAEMEKRAYQSRVFENIPLIDIHILRIFNTLKTKSQEARSSFSLF